MATMREERLADFEASFIPEPNSGCWLWERPGLLGPMGYGHFRYQGVVAAHRASWLLYRGPIPMGLFICHKCDNPSCVNPDHLYLGTAQDNIADRDRRGRTGGVGGENRRKTHCKNGHEFTDSNTMIRKQGWRMCRKCHEAACNRYLRKRRATEREVTP